MACLCGPQLRIQGRQHVVCHRLPPQDTPIKLQPFPQTHFYPPSSTQDTSAQLSACHKDITSLQKI